LNFGVRAFLCTFILAAVSKPILGVDFLSANRLLVDPHFGQVLDANTLDPITGSLFAAHVPAWPPHCATSRLPSALSCPLFPPSSATEPELQIRSTGFYTPLKR
jgi:hypothetical protein